MRRLMLILTLGAAVAGPAFAANPIENDNNPELRQCVHQCQEGNKKDGEAREACESRCAQANAARHKQQTGTPDGLDNSTGANRQKQ